MRYMAEKRLAFPPSAVWDVLKDLRHFAENDPFHHDFVWHDGPREGIGARFGLRHTYSPIFPFGSDDVECIVTEWKQGEAQSVLETNRRRYRSHTQRFELIPIGQDGTLVRFCVIYRGVPWILLPWRLWVDFWVLRRMRQKLDEIEKAVR